MADYYRQIMVNKPTKDETVPREFYFLHVTPPGCQICDVAPFYLLSGWKRPKSPPLRRMFYFHEMRPGMREPTAVAYSERPQTIYHCCRCDVASAYPRAAPRSRQVLVCDRRRGESWSPAEPRFSRRASPVWIRGKKQVDYRCEAGTRRPSRWRGLSKDAKAREASA